MGGELEKNKVLPFAPAEVQRKASSAVGGRKAPSAKNCRPYVRRRLARALPEIADALIDKAQTGSLPELKMLVQMSGLDDKDTSSPAEKRRGKSLEEMLMEDWRKESMDGPDA